MASESSSETAPRVAIVGAGLAGGVAGARLARAGVRVEIFEKARGPGGRASTRYADPWRFDHGMQFFTARSQPFVDAVEGWISDGAVAEWSPRCATVDPGGGGHLVEAPGPAATGDRWFVGVPGNNEPCRRLAAELSVRRGVRIGALDVGGGRPQLKADALPEDPGRAASARAALADPFDAVLLTAPAPQAARLLAPLPELAAQASKARIEPCLAAMLGWTSPPDVGWDVIRPGNDGPIAWAARHGSRPGRPGAPDGWVVHATPAWSREHLELERDEIAARLHAAFVELVTNARPDIGAPLRAPDFIAGHRWRFALASEPADGPYLWDEDARVGAAGDWCVAGRFEAAFTSGLAASDAIAATLGLDTGD